MLERNSRGLAATLFDELDALNEGKSTPQMARSKASVANTICAVSRLEMDYSRFVSASNADTDKKDSLSAIPMGIVQDK